MDLLFAVNGAVIPQLVTCLRSVSHRGGAGEYTAWVLHSDLTDREQEALRAEVPEDVSCRFVPVPAGLFEGFPVSARYPEQIYYRLAAPLLLPRELDRVLYLDTDTLVINPLGELYAMDFEGACCIACTHTNEFLTRFNQARLGLRGGHVPYVNTGVMLLDLPALRGCLRLEDIRRFAAGKEHTLLLPDQDIITALYGDRVKLADTLRFNLSDRILSFHNADPRNERLDLDWVRRNAVILHYCGKNKPWHEHYSGILGTFYREALQSE